MRLTQEGYLFAHKKPTTDETYNSVFDSLIDYLNNNGKILVSEKEAKDHCRYHGGVYKKFTDKNGKDIYIVLKANFFRNNSLTFNRILNIHNTILEIEQITTPKPKPIPTPAPKPTMIVPEVKSSKLRYLAGLGFDFIKRVIKRKAKKNIAGFVGGIAGSVIGPVGTLAGYSIAVAANEVAEGTLSLGQGAAKKLQRKILPSKANPVAASPIAEQADAIVGQQPTKPIPEAASRKASIFSSIVRSGGGFVKRITKREAKKELSTYIGGVLGSTVGSIVGGPPGTVMGAVIGTVAGEVAEGTLAGVTWLGQGAVNKLKAIISPSKVNSVTTCPIVEEEVEQEKRKRELQARRVEQQAQVRKTLENSLSKNTDLASQYRHFGLYQHSKADTAIKNGLAVVTKLAF